MVINYNQVPLFPDPSSTAHSAFSAKKGQLVKFHMAFVSFNTSLQALRIICLILNTSETNKINNLKIIEQIKENLRLIVMRKSTGIFLVSSCLSAFVEQSG